MNVQTIGWKSTFRSSFEKSDQSVPPKRYQIKAIPCEQSRVVEVKLLQEILPVDDIVQMKAAFDALSPDQKSALQRYQMSPPDVGGPYAYELNKALNENNSNRHQEVDVGLLDAAINAYSIKHPITLYRVETDGTRFASLKLGQRFKQRNYLSTSTRWNNLQTHIKASNPNTTVIIFTLRVLRGVHAAFLGSNEREVLLGRNQTFKVVATADGDPANYVEPNANPNIVALKEIILDVSNG